MCAKYASPPVIEAVCEFRLADETEWDMTVPGLIYEEIKDEFPHKDHRQIQQMGIRKTDNGPVHEMRTDERMLFLTDDRKMFVQIGKRLVAINCLQPYPAWDVFKQKIDEVFGVLKNNVELRGIQRVGLRYINRVDLPRRVLKLEEYFSFYPHKGEGLPKNIANFNMICVFPFHEGQEVCRVQLRDAKPQDDTSVAVMLDLDYCSAVPNKVPVVRTLEWVEGAHQKVVNVFEGCISDKLRDIFRDG